MDYCRLLANLAGSSMPSRPRVHPSQTKDGEGSSPVLPSRPATRRIQSHSAAPCQAGGQTFAAINVRPSRPSPSGLSYPHSEHRKALQSQQYKTLADGRPDQNIQKDQHVRGHGPQFTPIPHRGPTLQAPPVASDWPSWPSLTIKVERTQQRLDLADYFDIFSKHGFVIKVNCLRSKPSDLVTFCPPPRHPFWESGLVRTSMEPHQRTLDLRVSVIPHSHITVPSPLNPKIHHRSSINMEAHALTFGVMTSDNSMMEMLKIESVEEGFLFMQLNLQKQEIDVRFNYPLSNAIGTADFGRFRIRLRDLTEIQSVRSKDAAGKIAFIITLQTPPEFYRQTPHHEISFDSDPSRWSEWSSWSRQTEFVLPNFEQEFKASPLRLRTEHAAIDYGRWLTYSFVIDNSQRYADILHALSDYNISIKHLDKTEFTFMPRRDAEIWKHLELSSTAQQTSTSLFSGSGMAEMESGLRHLPFPVLWQLMVCISRGYLNEFNMTPEFLQKLDNIGEDMARNLLEHIADRSGKLKFSDPMDIFAQVKTSSAPPKRLPPYTSLLYSCSITPTTIYFSSPVVEVSNRVIRKFSEYQDRFLRVRFIEENSGRIHSQHDSSNEELFNRVRRFLKHGLVFGDRHYEFLAFGNSQFREHGLFAFASIKGLAEIPDMTATDIRSQLGDLSDIRNPAKWCARLGQNFSTTRSFATGVTIKEITDIKRGGYIFSDGVGNMSCFIAKMVGMEFGRAADDPPSVVQFRLGGCKGILAVVPDKQVQGCEIWIRASQRKFESKSQGLEIIRISQFVSATLNRQLILVLSSLGVADKVFTGMLRNMLSELEKAMVDGEAAQRLLTKNIDFNHMTLTLAGMIEDGFLESQEPFMVSMIRLWRSWTIKYLKEKAKIFVDKGACLFGCVDDTPNGVLKGHFEKDQLLPKTATREQRIAALPEIFVQIRVDGQYQPLQCICFIARNPSLHPGDIRMVRAVDRPELHHRKDVIVMPQTGDRDLGNMCSGGDLDGDDYLVVWDPALFPPMQEWNHPAMNFEAHAPVKLNRPVVVDDISEFFIQYLKNDQLPTIALAHLALADKARDGVKDPKCLALAHLHSHAVDYPKNGTPAQMTRDLRPAQWPHFMEKAFKSAHQIYHSDKVLGQLYDIIERVDFVPVFNKPFDQRILSAFDVSESIILKASEIKREYDAAILRIMAQLDIGTEFEVFSAFAMSFNREKKEYTLAEELGSIIQAHKNRFRDLCVQAAGGQSYDAFGPFLVAMYTATQRQVQAALAVRAQAQPAEAAPEVQSYDNMPLISFPWIFTKELGLMANGKFKGEQKITVAITAHTHSFGSKKAKAVSKSHTFMDLAGEFDIPLFKGPSHPAVTSIVSDERMTPPVLRPDTPLSVLHSEGTSRTLSTTASSVGAYDTDVTKEENSECEEESEDEEDEYDPGQHVAPLRENAISQLAALNRN